MIPGWLIGRLADEDADAVARLAGGVVATLAAYAACGFLAVELGLRVATSVVAVPLLVVVLAASLLGATAPRVARAPLAPMVGALALGLAALLGAWATHQALPAVPVEGAFSIEAAHAFASPKGVVVTVTVTRVRTEEPTQLQTLHRVRPRGYGPHPVGPDLRSDAKHLSLVGRTGVLRSSGSRRRTTPS